MKLYLAGPMTGIPQFNFPAFDTAREALIERGYDVVPPADLDDSEIRAAAMVSPDGAPGSGSPNGETWGDFLALDVKLVADVVDGVVCLPGWKKSRGSRLEMFVAYLCGKPVFLYPRMTRLSFTRYLSILLAHGGVPVNSWRGARG